MKRSPMPPRKARLKGSGLSQKARQTLNRKPLLAKPKPKTSDEVDARRIVSARSDGRCEIGIECSGGAYATDWSHRVGRGVGGPWDPANGLHACRRCHDWCHANPTGARPYGWLIKSTDDFRTFPIYHAVHGWVVLTSDGAFIPTSERPAA